MPDLRPQILLLLLPLLMVGLGFWVSSDLVTKQLLSLSYRTLDKLQADALPQVQLKLDFIVKNIEIEQEQRFTQVEIETAKSVLTKLEFEFPNSNFPEGAIAQQLGLYPQVKKIEKNTPVKVEIPVTLKVIRAEIEKGMSFVEVRTADNSLKKLDFILPVAEVKMVEEKISQVLNLSPEDVRKLIRYQVKNINN